MRAQIWHREHWDYNLDSGTLVFSDAGVPKVIASIQAVGTTSKACETWLWGWANESLPAAVTARICEVRDFGTKEGLSQLIEPELPADEFLGWQMTAIAAQIIGAKGAYRCPSECGFLYLAYTDVRFTDSPGGLMQSQLDNHTVDCKVHGSGRATYVCEHLVGSPRQEWFSDIPSSSNPWPDAWCSGCDEAYQEQGEWNGENSGRVTIKLLCDRCYETLRQSATTLA